MIKVISIHIPKTAGSSFFQILKKVYEKERILKIYGMRGEPEIIEMSLFPRKDVRKARVAHGHFRYSQMSHLIRKGKPLLITWLREPVERVISNYFYSMYRIREGIASEDKNELRDYSLLEWASLPQNVNVMSWFLEGSEPEDFFFIGLKERFQEDLEELGRRLKWPYVPTIPHKKDGSGFIKNNDCATQLKDINQLMRDEIAALNQDDIALYQKVVNSRS